jgi:hypothetical protein
MIKLKSLFTIALLLIIGTLSAQITTSSLSGKVVDGTNPVSEATVILTHVPTNSAYETTTDKQGRFNLENLNVGGPYKITVKSMNIKEYNASQIQLSLGDNDYPAIKVEKKDNVFEEVTISGKKTTKGNGTNISQTQINGLPNINRGLQDVTKLVPQSANNSFAGTNFRYNNVTIDGSINNDAIGFSPSLGGQS